MYVNRSDKDIRRYGDSVYFVDSSVELILANAHLCLVAYVSGLLFGKNKKLTFKIINYYLLYISCLEYSDSYTFDLNNFVCGKDILIALACLSLYKD